jgi:TonB family protein
MQIFARTSAPISKSQPHESIQFRVLSVSLLLLAIFFFPLMCVASPSDESGANQQSPLPPAMKVTTDGVEILSDTKGVNFGPYVKQVIHAIWDSWRPLIPESARPPHFGKGRVQIRFRIDPKGVVSGMVLEGPSGDRHMDMAAWGGITGAAPYPPLPVEFTGPYLELRLRFYYNLDPR